MRKRPRAGGVLGHPSHHQRGSHRNAGQLGSAPDGPVADQLSSQEEQCGGHDDHRNNHPTEQQMPDASTVVAGRAPPAAWVASNVHGFVVPGSQIGIGRSRSQRSSRSLSSPRGRIRGTASPRGKATRSHPRPPLPPGRAGPPSIATTAIVETRNIVRPALTPASRAIRRPARALPLRQVPTIPTINGTVSISRGTERRPIERIGSTRPRRVSREHANHAAATNSLPPTPGQPRPAGATTHSRR